MTVEAHAGAPISVLIVDDESQMRQMLRRTLAKWREFRVVGECSNGAQAIELARLLDPDLLLIDLVMPVMDGVQAIRALRETGLRARALVLTSTEDHDRVSAVIEAGADGYVLKGCPAGELHAALRDVCQGGTVLAPSVAREVVQDYARMLDDKRTRDLAVIRTLAGAVEARDPHTGDHANHVSTLAMDLWTGISREPAHEDLLYGFLLHDIGKIAIPDAILLKEGPLEAHEIEVMRSHVAIGVKLVEPLGFHQVVLDVIGCHHERWDGLGYPNGLGGEEIPSHARAFTVVDAYDAMVSDRPYRRGMSVDAALAELLRHSGTQFDPSCVHAFVDRMSPSVRQAATG